MDTLEDLKLNIKNFLSNNKKSIIILDRIDFLINRHSFQEFMNCMYNINDNIEKNDSIFIIKLNKSVLKNNEISILMEEFNPIIAKNFDNVYLEKSLVDILEFLFIEGKNHGIVTQTSICNKLKISKLTAKKRINLLIEKELIYKKNIGRTKQLYLNNKGMELIKKLKLK